jgi:Domain of unknown function (DUF4399)
MDSALRFRSSVTYSKFVFTSWKVMSGGKSALPAPLFDRESGGRLWIAPVSKLGPAVLAAALMLLPGLALAQGRTAPKDAYLYFVSPADGDTVNGAFRCRFGLRNMGVTHAGDSFGNSGHHHLLIDADEPISPGEPIPQDRKHLHYGAGETEALIELPPGKHTLQLVLGDGMHFNFDPPLVSQKITITVSNASQRHGRTLAHVHRRTGHLQVRTARSAPQTPIADAPPPDPSKSASAVDFIKNQLFGTK